MARTRRPSPQAAALVRSFARDPSRWRYGYELCQELGIKPGSMYPILMRLADRGFLETTWEADPEPGRPARHLYRLTGAGVEFADELVESTAETAERAAHAGSPRRVAPTTRPAGAMP